ncbi:MAG: hypothetical protein ACXWXQ_05095 [Actinomycetota bacterium]
MQLLKKAGLDDAAERAKGRFDEEWRTLKQIDPKLFDDDQGKRLEKVNAVVQLLRQVGSQYP